ncbi:MAG: hypothetical protein J0M16_12290 [Gammaproteobacteria bacterium]|nr:hypothetical protein [Gammaproteobacteria bacterium]
MRKLLATALVATGALGLSGLAGAATTVYEIDGLFGANEHSCTQISHVLGGFDCTYGRNWPAAAVDPDLVTPSWGGPIFGGAHYQIGSTGDSKLYAPTTGAWTGTGTAFTAAVDDGKYAAPITGTFTIDDNGTAGDPSDDKLSANFTIGAMVRNNSTGQSSRAIQRWTSMDHVMAPTTVNSATANGAGGVDYVIGSRGFPNALCNRNDAADCFVTPNSPNNATGDYDGDFLVTFWTPIPANSIGLERTGLMADPGFATASPKPPASPPTGNVGATTTGTINGGFCDSTVASDCVSSPLLWGAGESPGFDNMVMKVSTNSAGAITSAQVYWTQEYFISAFGALAGYDNSVQYGEFTFTGVEQSLAPNARDFAATVIQDTTTNTLATVTNSVNFNGPVTITIVTPPAAGTATVNGDQTINYNATGVSAGEQTLVYEATDGADTDQGTITITVAADVNPNAPDGSITISTQGAAPGSATVGTVNVTTLGSYSAGNGPATVSIFTQGTNGTASVTGGNTVRYQPNASFYQGTDTVVYRVTDVNGDTEDGTITVTIADLTPALNDGAVTTDQDTTSSSLALGITPGNGSVGQHTLAVTTQGTNGTCNISGTSLTYAPDAGYFGTDSCVVTITDENGAGDSDTGTFSITVNEVDDSLNLPGGGSALDVWSLLLLGGAPLLRRRRPA